MNGKGLSASSLLFCSYLLKYLTSIVFAAHERKIYLLDAEMKPIGTH
jgi:hypothetical protein